MGKIWEQVYTDINPDTTTNPNGVITVAAGMKHLAKIPFPYEGRIGKIICKQLSSARGGGASVAFDFAIYTTAVITVGDSNDTLPDNAPLFEAVPVKGAIAGTALRDFTPEAGGDGFLFRNYDGDQTNVQRFCYLYIAPVGSAGETKWEFALGAWLDVGK